MKQKNTRVTGKLRRIIAFLVVMVMCAYSGFIPAMQVCAADSDELITVNISGSCYYEEAYKVLALVNEEREAQGLFPLEMDEELLVAAMNRAAECVIYFSHTRPNGEKCFSIADNMNGENIAYGFESADRVMKGWMNSEGHKANILRERFNSVGIGCFCYQGTMYWSQCFGSNTAVTASERQDSVTTYPIVVQADGITLTARSSQLQMNVGEETKTAIKVSFANFNTSVVANNDSFEWVSSDEGVVTVDEGWIQAVGSGTAEITATLGDISVTLGVTVLEEESDTEEDAGDYKDPANPSTEDNGDLQDPGNSSTEDNGDLQDPANPSTEGNEDLQDPGNSSTEDNGDLQDPANPSTESNGDLQDSANSSTESNGDLQDPANSSTEGNGDLQDSANQNTQGQPVSTTQQQPAVTTQKNVVTQAAATNQQVNVTSQIAVTTPQKGTKLTDKKTNAIYKVTKQGESVTYVAPLDKSVKKAVIPNTVTISGTTYKVTAIATKAFASNKKLTQVTIGNQVTNIGTKAFYGCKNLKKITIKTTNLTKSSIGTKAFKKIAKKAVFKMPKSKKKEYKKWIL